MCFEPNKYYQLECLDTTNKNYKNDQSKDKDDDKKEKSVKRNLLKI